jgi:hypothetical protein
MVTTKSELYNSYLKSCEVTYPWLHEVWNQDWVQMPREEQINFMYLEVDSLSLHIAVLRGARANGELSAAQLECLQAVEALEEQARPIIEKMEAALNE